MSTPSSGEEESLRTTIGTGRNRLPRLLLCALLVSGLSIGAAGTVSGSNGGPTGAAAKKKKKCKKALWKCAPEHYHLSVTGHRGPQTYSAEVDLEKNRSNFAKVEYSQKGGTLTASTTYEGLPIEIDMCANARYVVTNATTQVPRRGLFGDFDFALFFWAKGKQWKYSVLGGGVYSELTFPGTVTCLEGDSAGVSAPFSYYFHGPLGVGNPRFGKPGANGLTGNDTYGSNNSLRWRLTTK
jgi:hypothetical protein